MQLSVLLPVFYKESAANLSQCLESLFAQTIPADEIVLVEDGPLGAELKQVISDFDRILPIASLRLPLHVGLGGALRMGLLRCRGEYVARMDSDDICVPERFEKQVDFLDSHAQVDVVGSAIGEFDMCPSDGRSIRRLPTSGRALLQFARIRNPLNHMTVMFRKASVLYAGNYQPFSGFEDYHLWARMLSLGYRLQNMEEILVHVRGGNAMHGRRGGLAYLKKDVEFQLFLCKTGLVDAGECIRNIAMRAPVRLAPDFVRSLCYRTFLRGSEPGAREVNLPD